MLHAKKPMGIRLPRSHDFTFLREELSFINATTNVNDISTGSAFTSHSRSHRYSCV